MTLINDLISFRDEQAEDNKKMSSLITYIMKQIYSLDTLSFINIGQALGLVKQESQSFNYDDFLNDT